MKRTPLANRLLPDYTHGEEIFNMVTHIVGGAVGIAAVALCVVFAALKGNIYGVVSGALFGGSMVLLYAMSSIYHGLHPHLMAKLVFQVLDHCTIFILIAGTYTPYALCTFREYSPGLGWTIFGIIWGIAALGVTLNAIDLKRYSKFSMVCYLVMGWCIVFTGPMLPKLLPPGGFWLLLSGGIAYTVGAVLYAVGRSHRYAHSVFHIFVVFGSILHFLSILFYVI